MRTVDRPVRRWTMASARAIAFHLASLPYPRRLLCHDKEGSLLVDTQELSFAIGASETNEMVEKFSGGNDERLPDSKSMSQRIFSTAAVRLHLLSVNSVPSGPLGLGELLRAFDKSIAFVRTRLSNRPEEGCNSSTALMLSSALKLLFDFITETGTSVMPRDFQLDCAGANDQVMLRMATQLAEFIAQYGEHRLVYGTCSALVSTQKFLLMEALLRVFLKNWSCHVLIGKDCLAGHALRASDSFGKSSQ